MNEAITFEELAEMNLFEGIAALSLIRRGDLTLRVGDRTAGRAQVEKMMKDLLRVLEGRDPMVMTA
ncbi:hypothetical protein [Methanofollis fontis]|uniref:Uncharacterized protein n=1 Tax=Methanofollis fontis TaxID=2052832 RepID=A0A483CW89_9EURY|nr:hypothetical protein [Methanofollis fontis]TAJ45440.1 hypothetical protein CUJ86_01515 [Methanofollis fontis]